jgi:aerobic C4-dicarboxylate transport protein
VQKKKSIFSSLYFQVLTGISLGILLGHFFPAYGEAMKPLGDGFIKLIKMVIAPIIFGTIVVGIARMGDMRKVGRVGVKALIYFELVTTVALIIGLIIVRILEPGTGMHVDPNSLDASSVAVYASKAKSQSTLSFVMNIIPDTVVSAFAQGEILQVLLFSLLFGVACAKMGEHGKTLITFIDDMTHAFFAIIGMIMRLAPIGAFGAMGFTIGKYGVDTLKNLAFLMGSVYATCLIFIFVALGAICKYYGGFSVWKYIKYIKEEFLIVLGTSSSESALPLIMKKLEAAGCPKPVVGLVIPTGYSFNLDGTSIYLTMAAIFVAQACDIPLTLGQELTILGVLLLTSKGAAAVTGGGFITLAATFSTIDTLPVAGLALLLGVDRFMSEARALTNLIGNGIATIVVAKWEGVLDEKKLHQALNGRLEDELPEKNK